MAEACQCDRCIKVPESIDPEALFLYTTAPTSSSKFESILAALGLTSSRPMPQALLIEGQKPQFEDFIHRCRNDLSCVEQAETRGVFMTQVRPSAEDLSRAVLDLVELESLAAQLEGHWLLDAIREEALFVEFQPLVSLRDKQVVAYECLLRARANGTVIQAAPLLRMAVQMKQLPLLDRLARRLAVTKGQVVLQKGLSLFVNFMPSSIYDYRRCLQDTAAACRELSVAMPQLVFEMVEAEKVPDLRHLRNIIDTYRRMGANVALDDVGSGYSSMLYIAELQPDWVKLDQGLVRQAHSDRMRPVLLKAITDAAHELGIRVVAEGIETPEDLKFCIHLGVDLLQGHFLARPGEVPPEINPDAVRILP